MKKITAIICTLILIAVIPLSVSAKTILIGDVNNDGKVNAADARLVLRVSAGIDPPFGTIEIPDDSASTDEEVYHIGDTWRVAGQWELTITSVEETADRNEYSDKNPEAVYIVNYTYKNIGYVDQNGIMDGLYMTIDDTIVDSAGKMGYSYPGDISTYPEEVPVGAYIEAQACIGVDNDGSFKLYVTDYDGYGNEHNAVFEVEAE
ncbi:MAG: hypothetical protein IJ289_05875 [Clostridia bacterium]|nr:hypothetical protein [Clostridia bacterium]